MLAPKKFSVANHEEGILVIEASIISVIAIAMICALINMSFLVYQRLLGDATAKDAAEAVANVYALTYRDPFYGYVENDDFASPNLYRYLENAFTGNLTTKNSRKAEWYALYTLKKNELWKGTVPEVEAEVVRKPGCLLEHQMVVTITARHKIPFPVFWGGNKIDVEVVSTGRADCIDMIDYINTVDFSNELVNNTLEKFPFVNVKDINALIGGNFVQDVLNFAEKTQRNNRSFQRRR